MHKTEYAKIADDEQKEMILEEKYAQCHNVKEVEQIVKHYG